MIRCEAHGLCFLSAVSLAVQRAVQHNERWSKQDLVRIRSDFTGDQEPRARLWLDRALAGERDEEFVPLAEAMEVASGHVCCECLDAWLHANGVDDGYSAEEQRFLRMEEALTISMRPRLEPTLEAINRVLFARDGRSGIGFPSRRGVPFSAYAVSTGAPVAQVEVRDHRDHLVAAVVVVPVGTTAPAPLRIDLLDGELLEGGCNAVAAWADAVALALRP